MELKVLETAAYQQTVFTSMNKCNDPHLGNQWKVNQKASRAKS